MARRLRRLYWWCKKVFFLDDLINSLLNASANIGWEGKKMDHLYWIRWKSQYIIIDLGIERSRFTKQSNIQKKNQIGMDGNNTNVIRVSFHMAGDKDASHHISSHIRETSVLVLLPLKIALIWFLDVSLAIIPLCLKSHRFHNPLRCYQTNHSSYPLIT